MSRRKEIGIEYYMLGPYKRFYSHFLPSLAATLLSLAVQRLVSAMCDSSSRTISPKVDRSSDIAARYSLSEFINSLFFTNMSHTRVVNT